MLQYIGIRLFFLRSILVFSRRIAKSFLYALTAATLLSSCSFVQKHTSKDTYNSLTFNDEGSKEANLATVAYSQGDFAKAEEHFNKALTQNPKNAQALMVGALTYEQIGRPNRARAFYEDIILYAGDQTTVLGSKNMLPEKMADIARKRLRLININQSTLVIEDKNGAKIFNISEEAAQRQGKSAIEEALFVREQKRAASNQASSEADVKAVEVLFNEDEKNIISRFLILKELAENDMITKDEFLNARMSNIGGLLPLTNTPPAYGINNSVPSPDIIIERIKALKEAVEARAITPREFSAERDIIVEAILPPSPRQRMKPKAPSKDILSAAKDLRKLEVIYDLNLITSKEKEKEHKAIEKYLGINKAPTAAKPVAPASVKEVIETKTEIKETVRAAEPVPAQPAPQPLLPEVSNPF